MTEKIIHQCPLCKSDNLKWSQFYNHRGEREKTECTCLDCGHNGDWEKFCVSVPVYTDKLCWVSEGLLYDIKDFLEKVNNQLLQQDNVHCDDLIEKINEVFKNE